MDKLLEKGKLTIDDQDWLEKELEVMEKKLKACKQKQAGKVKAA